MEQFSSLTIEQYNNRRGVTLVELSIAICIFAIIVMGFSSIDTFSRYHVIISDRRVKLQNDASYVLEHMAKEISKAIGDYTNIPVVIDDSNRRIKVYIDYNADGQRSSGDRWIAYRYRDSSAPAAEQYQIWYCPQCTDSTCDTCNPAWGTTDNTLTKKISSFTPPSVTGNYVNIQLTACWDPDGSPVVCGTVDNPALEMKNRIYMPAVSTN